MKNINCVIYALNNINVTTTFQNQHANHPIKTKSETEHRTKNEKSTRLVYVETTGTGE